MDEETRGHRFGTVALLGPPNAGKSTLLNALLGQKVAIVTPKPQTTRNQISGILTRPEGQAVLLDTPGVHGHGGRMNRMLLQAAWSAAAGADVLAVVLDAAQGAREHRRFASGLAPMAKPLAEAGAPLLALLNKVDLVRGKEALLPLIEELSGIWPRAEVLPISAASGDGLDVLTRRIFELLPPGEAMYPEDQLSTLSLRFMAAEIVREKLFLAMRQEVPYSVAVEIETFEEATEETGGVTRIGALVWVAREAHKAMVIGKGGATLKEIGTQARLELAELLGTRVFLEIWVKVRRDWTEDVGFLRGLGLGE